MQDLEIIGWPRVVFTSGVICGSGNCLSTNIQECENSSLTTILDQSSKTLIQSGRINTSTHGLLSTTSLLVEIGFLRLPSLFWYQIRTELYVYYLIWLAKQSSVADLILQIRNLKPEENVILFIHLSTSLSSTFNKCLQGNGYCAGSQDKIRPLTLRNSQLSRTER